MRTVLPIKAFEPFTPDVIAEMDAAFKAAIAVIETKTGRPATDLSREVVALRVVDAAQRGINDRHALRDDAVRYWERGRVALPDEAALEGNPQPIASGPTGQEA